MIQFFGIDKNTKNIYTSLKVMSNISKIAQELIGDEYLEYTLTSGMPRLYDNITKEVIILVGSAHKFMISTEEPNPPKHLDN